MCRTHGGYNRDTLVLPWSGPSLRTFSFVCFLSKAFPTERDLFSDIEDALAAAVQLHVERAKVLVKKDRAAAAKEVKRCV